MSTANRKIKEYYTLLKMYIYIYMNLINYNFHIKKLSKKSEIALK